MAHHVAEGGEHLDIVTGGSSAFDHIVSEPEFELQGHAASPQVRPSSQPAP